MRLPDQDRQAMLALWALWAVIVTSALAVVLAVLAAAKGAPVGDSFAFVVGTAVLGLGLTGILIVRRAANPIGWLFVAMGMASAVATLAGSYTDIGLFVRPLPLVPWASRQ